MKKVVLLSSVLAIGCLFAGKNIIPAGTKPAVISAPEETLYNAGLKFGTQGIGLDISRAINPNLAVRFNVINYFKYNKKDKIGQINYDAHLKLLTAGVLLDYFPSNTSTFRMSIGAYYNKNKITATATPSSNVKIGNTTYTPAQIAQIDTSITFNKLAPYIGIGWGNKPSKSGWQFNFDLGVMYQGTPKVNTKVTTNVAIPGLQNNIEVETNKIRDDIKKYKWYPVVSIGISKSF